MTDDQKVLCNADIFEYNDSLKVFFSNIFNIIIFILFITFCFTFETEFLYIINSEITILNLFSAMTSLFIVGILRGTGIEILLYAFEKNHHHTTELITPEQYKKTEFILFFFNLVAFTTCFIFSYNLFINAIQ